jgi:hypothetical protein
MPHLKILLLELGFGGGVPRTLEVTTSIMLPKPSSKTKHSVHNWYDGVLAHRDIGCTLNP